MGSSLTRAMAMEFRRNARPIWPAGRFALLATTMLYLTCTTISRTASLSQSAEGVHSLAEAHFDWNADGVPDRFRLRAQKEVGYATDGSGRPPSRKKSTWYHCWFIVQSGADHSMLWEDEWSVKDADLLSFREILDFRDARSFFGNWFTWSSSDANNQKSLMNSFEIRRVTSEDISDEVLLAETKRLKIEASPARLKQEMLNDPALRIFVYRASRREDVRWAAYIPSLQKVMLFRYGFSD
jgi:hypothetical protein